MINFIPNDPLAVDDLPIRQVAARPDRPAGRAGIKVSGNVAEGRYQPDDPNFVPWQARQAAILALEAWEDVLGKPLSSWSQEAVNPASLLLLPDADEDINAYYDRETLSFFHKKVGATTTYSGASADVVAHEAGHGILDALRPDLWAVNMLEVGGFHEGFGDVTAILTALSDRPTREKLLAVSPNLGTANFVEATAEQLADTARKVFGAGFSAAKPRRALNTFQWQLPQTLPKNGGPDVMIAEVHSLARIISGCFYDVLRAIFAASGTQTQAALWTATKTAAALFYEAARTAPAVPRFFRAVGRSMVLADDTLNGGAHRTLIGQAFNDHGLALGAQALLAPELALAGNSPKKRRNVIHVEPKTIADLRGLVGAGNRAAASVNLVEIGGQSMASVAIRDEVALDKVDKRLAGVVAAVESVALVGASGGSAALMSAPRAGAANDEVLDFVSSLVAHDQIAFTVPKTPRKRAVAAAPTDQEAGRATHAVKRRRGKQELQRVRFACGGC